MANINKNIIMQAGAAVANATNKAAGLSTATPEPGAIISAIQLVNGGLTIGPEALAHFTESVRNKLLSLLVSLKPIQNFNGYDHPWPGGATKNKLPKAIAKQETINGVTFNLDENGVFTITGTATGTATCMFPVGYTFNILSGDPKPKFSIGNSVGTNRVSFIFYSGDTIVETWACTTVNRVSEYSSMQGKACDSYAIQVDGGYAADMTLSPMIVENSVTDYSYVPYSNICPISGRTGLHVYAGPTSAIGDATAYSMDWTSPAGTVYAGGADIVTGDIKAATYYASYNGETLVGPWVSSMDVYDPEGTPTTGAQVVDLGGTMTEYHITGQDIITLVGDNYIWSDSGDVTITE